jgi:hypothetical protein
VMPVLSRHDGKAFVDRRGKKPFVVFLNTREVSSSNVDWVGWPCRSERTEQPEPIMIVQFTGGKQYAYLGVPRQRAVAAALADSTGEYINKKIKPHYDVVRLA